MKLLTREQILKKRKSFDEICLEGIYFLLDGKEIVYIGQSNNIYNRLVTHIANRGKERFNTPKFFDYITIEHMPGSTEYERKRKEYSYIIEFNPKYNLLKPIK